MHSEIWQMKQVAQVLKTSLEICHLFKLNKKFAFALNHFSKFFKMLEHCFHTKIQHLFQGMKKNQPFPLILFTGSSMRESQIVQKMMECKVIADLFERENSCKHMRHHSICECL